MAKEFQRLLYTMLAPQPRSEADDDPGFWSDGDRILCPSEYEAEVIANILEDVTAEYGSLVCTTGYYDPNEDEDGDTKDPHTGFYYVSVE